MSSFVAVARVEELPPGARFDIRTGRVTRLPATDAIPTYRVKVEEGLVYVEEPELW